MKVDTRRKDVWRFDKSQMNRHLWAFYYYCRRQGDVTFQQGRSVYVIRKPEAHIR